MLMLLLVVAGLIEQMMIDDWEAALYQVVIVLAVCHIHQQMVWYGGLMEVL